MKSIYGAVCLFVFISAGVTSAISASFENEEIMPKIKYLMFSQDAVSFISPEINYYFIPEDNYYFIYDRSNRNILEVDVMQLKKRFPEPFPKKEPITETHTGEQRNLIGHTSGGVGYKSTIKYCGEGVTDEIRKLVVNNKIVNIKSREVCTNVSSVEIVDDQLWLGTAYFGEAGYYKEAEGVIVQQLNGKAVLGRIALQGAIIQVKADPFSDSVWVVTYFGIYEISRQFKILATYLYTPDFEPLSGEPRFSFSNNIGGGNPLSIISRRLPIADRKSFYEAVKKIPPNDLKGLNLYDFLYNFFMACSSVHGRWGESNWPESFQPLFPFFIKVNTNCANLTFAK